MACQESYPLRANNVKRIDMQTQEGPILTT
nr:MAG TPA: hypothetical protein [Caudoviricetes sp.]